jgi:hypothetical protein
MAFANDCVDIARVPANAIPVIKTEQCTCNEVRIQLKDLVTGDPYDLTALGLGLESSSSSSSSSGCCHDMPSWCEAVDGGNSGVQIVLKGSPSDASMALNKYATIKSEADAQNGIVYLQHTPAEMSGAGIWNAMAIVRVCGVARALFPLYFEIRPSLDQINVASGPITIYEVRLDLRDTHPDVNFLLDTYDFQDHEIAFMIRKAVDLWNETPPHTVATHTPATFPFRANWINVTGGELMRMVADWLRRNDLDYQAAGLTVKDTAKWPYYREEGLRRIQEFKAWALTTKATINLEGAFASMGGYRYIVPR